MRDTSLNCGDWRSARSMQCCTISSASAMLPISEPAYLLRAGKFAISASENHRLPVPIGISLHQGTATVDNDCLSSGLGLAHEINISLGDFPASANVIDRQLFIQLRGNTLEKIADVYLVIVVKIRQLFFPSRPLHTRLFAEIRC